jgi:putative spermidine/putrescine transport system permease protein
VIRRSPALKRVLIVWTTVALVLLYVPLALVVLNSFNASRTFGFPPSGFTLRWWAAAAGSSGALAALGTSVLAGLCATAIALVLGTMAAFAVQRYRFFGRRTVSFLVVLPITLPGIVTGIALNATFTSLLGPVGVTLGLGTVIVGHATFCIVIVFNNVAARLRRLGTSFEEASADLGATPWQTFRMVTVPLLRGALVAGALLAFALSFDEIVVTTFTAGPTVQTLPIWIFGNLFRPNQAPVVNVVAAVLTLVAVVPVSLAQRLGGDVAGSRF